MGKVSEDKSKLLPNIQSPLDVLYGSHSERKDV